MLLSLPAPCLTRRSGPGGWPLGGAAAPAPRSQVPVQAASEASGPCASPAAGPPLCPLPGQVPMLSSLLLWDLIHPMRFTCHLREGRFQLPAPPSAAHRCPAPAPNPPSVAWPRPSHSCPLLPQPVRGPLLRVSPAPAQSPHLPPTDRVILSFQTAELPRPRSLAPSPRGAEGHFPAGSPTL